MAETKDKILIVDKNQDFALQLKHDLVKSGYKALVSLSGKNGLEMLASHCPDLVIVEIELPDIDGMTFIRKVRSWSNAPLIVLSVKNNEVEKARMLDMGADDYLVKPVGIIELSARIRTAFRHTLSSASSSKTELVKNFCCRQLEIDFLKHKVFVEGKDSHLTPNEFRLLSFLAKHCGETVSYRQVAHELWGPSAIGDNKILRVHIFNLRKKIEKNPEKPQYIITQLGLGYMLSDE